MGLGQHASCIWVPPPLAVPETGRTSGAVAGGKAGDALVTISAAGGPHTVAQIKL